MPGRIGPQVEESFGVDAARQHEDEEREEEKEGVEEEEEEEDEAERLDWETSAAPDRYEPPPPAPLEVAELEGMWREADEALRLAFGVELPGAVSAAKPQAASRRHGHWDIDIPSGKLLYPCCGQDTEHAASLFGPYVSELHFADPFARPPGRRELGRTSKADRASQVQSLPHIGNVAMVAAGSRTFEVRGRQAFFHSKDGLLTLLQDVGTLSVFYYRGDSEGEGGSDQRWLMPVLFDVVMSSLVDGGIIYTDGSNGGGAFGYPEDPTAQVGSLPRRPTVGDSMPYRGRTLRCVFTQQFNAWRAEAAWQVCA